jgi:hypothetical protein
VIERIGGLGLGLIVAGGIVFLGTLLADFSEWRHRRKMRRATLRTIYAAADDIATTYGMTSHTHEQERQ